MSHSLNNRRVSRLSTHQKHTRNGEVNKSMLSPLLGRFTEEEFHKNLIDRICPSCELETLKDKPPAPLVEFNWKLRKHGEKELFEGIVDRKANGCPLHPKVPSQIV